MLRNHHVSRLKLHKISCFSSSSDSKLGGDKMGRLTLPPGLSRSVFHREPMVNGVHANYKGMTLGINYKGVL